MFTLRIAETLAALAIAELDAFHPTPPRRVDPGKSGGMREEEIGSAGAEKFKKATKSTSGFCS